MFSSLDNRWGQERKAWGAGWKHSKNSASPEVSGTECGCCNDPHAHTHPILSSRPWSWVDLPLGCGGDDFPAALKEITAISLHQDATPELQATFLSPPERIPQTCSLTGTHPWVGSLKMCSSVHSQLNTHNHFVPKDVYLQPHFPSHSSAERTRFHDVCLPCLSASTIHMCLSNF